MKRILFLLLISLIFISILSCSKNDKNIIISSDNYDFGHLLFQIEIISKKRIKIDEQIEIKSRIAYDEVFYTPNEIKIEASNFIIYTADGTKHYDYFSIKSEDFEKNGTLSLEDYWYTYLENFKFKYDGTKTNDSGYIYFYVVATAYETYVDSPCESSCSVRYQVKNDVIKLIY